MKVPLTDEQSAELWKNAPPEAVRAIDLLARRILERRIRRLKEREETNQGGSSDE